MNSKVKVHVVDGSKCVLDCRHDKEEPRPRRPSILGCSGVLSGFLSKTNQDLGLGQVQSRQRHPNIEKTGCRAAWWLTMV